MSVKSVLHRVLESLTISELRALAKWRGLKMSGDENALVRRVVEDAGDDLTQVLSGGGSPWSRNDWNDLVERRFAGRRRKSWSDVAAELDERVRASKQRAALAVGESWTCSRCGIGNELAYKFCVGCGAAAASRVAGGSPCPRCETDNDPAFVFCVACGVPLAQSDEPSPSLAPSRPSTDDYFVAESEGDAGWERTRDLPRPPIGYLLAGRFRIVCLLGKGGFGWAFEVADSLDDAMLPLVAKLAQTNRAQEALGHELHKALQLVHPNTCRYHRAHEDEKYGRFLILEHGGQSLADRFASRGASVEEAVRIFAQVAAALDHLHATRVGHADVSPMNILMDDGGQVRLTDFGIALDLETREASWGRTQMAEPRAYNPAFAPLEMRGPQGVFRRGSDQAALAASFCAVLQGGKAYSAKPRFRFRRLSASQQAAVDRALGEDPGDRFPSCTASRRSGEPAGPTGGAPPRAARPRARASGAEHRHRRRDHDGRQRARGAPRARSRFDSARIVTRPL